MPQINQLSTLDEVTSGLQVPVYSPNNGDARRVSMLQILEYFQESFSSPELAVNISTPGTGFNTTVPTPSDNQQWMLLQPAGTLATGTITLPLNTSTPDGTEVLVTTTQQITSFTLAVNGAAAVYGAPSTLAAEDFFRVRFVESLNSWYRIA